ncbi:TPA: multidrug efflux transporter transcriptional repressor MepR [Staphylococcus aureus]|uniref:multidrug efflux transporter transcriptional repressor MepR n=1 Tax=Staphylococcus aureus TaxID=1280 RepID=UPI0010FDF1DE|nr:multidrug efflux transporter transcriptional repressor MepR [Staphylococcus aureus]TLM01242.1 multidrug efflux transporter transcriptional repressor MepR [Staphylococcus aureus]HAR5635370.1 multidrug efflux transporter transcriptional repressor MepR [Staphylococcus aureus]HAR6826664.1 multidrug efflux transporter transcriptional repressor MepR [Staphylococcus aureus]HAZ5635936.1 multidrug efflux transporter transcriptional repressor MepR [Staphylococcus aureus]HDJ3190326.1 multidrug efflux 
MEFTYSYLFRMISHEMKQKADQKLEQFDITNEQGHTLGYLYAHQQDGLTQNDIAKALQRTGPTVSNLLRNLERKKLIYRYVDAQDTRRKNIRLTTSGIKLVEAFTSIFDEMEQTLVSQLSEEENEQMKANLTKMLSSLQ